LTNASTKLVPIVLADPGTDDCRMSLWLVPEGEAVLEGDRIAEVLIPGVLVDVVAPEAGILHLRQAQPGDPLKAGQVLGFIQSVEL